MRFSGVGFVCFQRFTPAYVGSNGIIRAQSAKFWAKNWAKLNPFLSSLFSSAVDSRVLAEADIIRVSIRIRQPMSARILARISASSSVEIFPFLAARRFRQSKLLTWSAKTALAFPPLIATSKG